MGLEYPLIDVSNISESENRLGAELKLAISEDEGSSTIAHYMTLKPGLETLHHQSDNCTEILVCISGKGKVTIGSKDIDIRTGHSIHLPVKTPFKLKNEADSPVEFVGFCINAGSLENLAFSEAREISDSVLSDELVVHWDNVNPENMKKDDGWHINDFRLPFGNHTNCPTTLFRALFFPGAVHKKHSHENCEEIYYIISGHGLAGAGPDRVEVTAGQFHYIPAGVEHWLYNLSETDPIHVVGVYINAGSVEETGYVYHGDVTPKDIKSRTILDD